MTNIFDDQTDAKRAYREMHILRYRVHVLFFHVLFYLFLCLLPLSVRLCSILPSL